MGCFLLPWAVEEGAEQVAKAVARAGAHPTEEEAHACCGSDGEVRIWQPNIGEQNRRLPDCIAAEVKS
jgi:hypothetical protein